MMANPPPASITPGIPMREYLLQLYPNLDDLAVVKQQVETLKASGNSTWKAGNYKTAIDLYTEAISRIGTHQEFMHEAAILYSNRSAVYSVLEKYVEALQDALASLSCDPKWHKGYWRKATVLKCLNQLADAYKSFMDGFFNSEGTQEVVMRNFLFEAVCLLHKISEQEIGKCYDILKPVGREWWEPLLIRLGKAAEWWVIGYLMIGPDLKNLRDNSYDTNEIKRLVKGVSAGVSTEGVPLKTLFKFLKEENPKTVAKWLDPLTIMMCMHSPNHSSFHSLCEAENDTTLHAAVRFSLLIGRTTLLNNFQTFMNQVYLGIHPSPGFDFALDGNGDTVFHTMAKFRPLPELRILKKVAKLMLSAGLDAAVKNKDGKLPVDYLDKSYSGKIFTLFMNACYKFTTADIPKLKEDGNAKFKRGDHQDALEAYSRGIWVFKKHGSQVPAGMTKRDIAALYGNRAAIFLSQNRFQEALDDAVMSVVYDGHWYKSHMHVGHAHKKLGNLEISLRALLDALKCAVNQSDNIKVEIIMDLTQTYRILPRDKFPLETKIPETPITYELLWYRAAYSFIKKDCWDEAYIAYVQACTNRPEEAHFPVSLKPLCNIDKAKIYPWVMQIIHYFIFCHSDHQEISCYPGDIYFHAVAYMTLKAGSSKNKRSLSLLQYILDNFVLEKNEQDLLDKDGNTALHVIVREPCQDDRHQHQIITLLAEARVNPHIKNHEGKTVRDVTYSIHTLNKNIISTIEENYYILRKWHDEDPELCKARQIKIREMVQKRFAKANPKTMSKMQAQALELKKSKTGEIQGQNRLPDDGNHVQGQSNSLAADHFPISCNGCDQLIEDSELDFSKGNMDDGYQKLVRVLEFRHTSIQHRIIIDKVISIIIQKLGKSPTPEITDSLTAMSENMYRHVIEGLIKEKKWRQVDAAAQKYRIKNGSDKMNNFATCVDLVEVVEDTSFRTEEDIKLQIMNTILDSGASLGKDDGGAAVQAAISEGHFKVVAELLKRGANSSALSLAAGDTPIHAALMIALEKDKGYLTLFEMLLRQFDSDPEKFACLDPSQVNASGDCLFHLLAKCKFSITALKAVEILCVRKLNSSVRNSEGKLPIDYITKENDRRKQFLRLVASPDLPQTRSSSCAKDSTIKKSSIQQTTARKITEVVKSSTQIEAQKKKIEEMIRLLEDSKLSVFDLSASKPFMSGPKQEPSETVLSVKSKEVSVKVTESTTDIESQKSNQNIVSQVMKKKEGEGVEQKADSDNAVNSLAMKTEKMEMIEEIDFDAQVFDNLAWEVHCTADVWKKLQDKGMQMQIKTRIVQSIRQLASGEWEPHLCKKLSKVPHDLQLYEAKVSKGGRVLWQLALAFSPRSSKTMEQCLAGDETGASHSAISGNIYSEIIRVWDIELDHMKLHRSIEKSVERIIKSHSWGKTCHIQKKLLPSFQTQTSAERRIPMLFVEVEEEVNLKNLPAQQKKQLQQYFPPASPSRKEYHTLKFYPFNSTLVNHVLQNTDITVDFPFCVTEREHAIITLRSNTPLLLLGRSGTGKTTCCLYRLFSKFREYWTMAKEADDPLQPSSLKYVCHKGEENGRDESNLNDEETELGTVVAGITKEGNSGSQHYHIHQIFVTKNAVLCSEAQKQFQELSRACYMLHNHVEQKAKNLPNRFQDVDECLYPLFITSRQLLLMLDASIGAPYFFERKQDGSLKVNIQGWSDSDGPLSRMELFDEDSDMKKEDNMDSEDLEQHAAGTPLNKVEPRREVTYIVFENEVWPRIKKTIKVSYHPSLVWTEIMSFIKGSYEAISKICGYLSKEEYIVIGRKKAPNFSGERDKIYEYFTRYNHFKKQNRLFDETDLVHHIYKRLQKFQMTPWVIHQIFVDETQDFTQAELCLLIKTCQDPNQMFLTGDTAQSIMRGISFRFCDLKSLFLNVQQTEQVLGRKKVEVPKQVYQLTHNYRSHAGILSLATSVLDLLVEFFPESFDQLKKDQALFNGPQPVLIESCSFSDLALILRGNCQKIKFGANQVIMVVDDASRDSIAKEFKHVLILTIYEAKGLEFDDVILYNFFKDSLASKEWRLVTNYLEHLSTNEKVSLLGTTSESLVEIDAAVLMREGRPRPLTFDPNQHKVLNSELKLLYTALTRACNNIWIFDEDPQKRAPMFEYFKARKLVRCPSVEKLKTMTFAQKSSQEGWIRRGEDFMKNALYEMSAKCFGMAGETLKQKIALAHQRAYAASLMMDDPHAMCEEYLKAAEMYLKCDLPVKAAICLQNARERKLAALLFEKVGEFERAAEIHHRLKHPLESSRCYELGGNFNRAVEVLCENESYDMALDTLRRYKMMTEEYELRGEPIPQILITNKPSDRFSEEGISYLAANFFHKHNNRERMLDALSRLRCWQDQVEFLKQNKYLEEAVQTLEENGQRDEAVNLLLIHGRMDQAEQTARKTLQENIIAQTLLVKFQVIMSHEPMTLSCTNDLQRTVMEAKTLFQNCRNLDGFAEASLFLADFSEGVTDLTESVAHIKQAWRAFLESKPYGNLAGTLECVEWIVTHKQITKENFMYLVRGFDHLFKVLQILCCSKSSQNQELLQKYDSFYGLFSTKPDYVVYYPKQKPRCKNILKNDPPSKQERVEQIEIETEMKAAHEMIASYLLNRAKGWLKDAVKEVTKMRNKVQQCLFYQVGLPCPDMEMKKGICPNLHCPLSNRTFEELIEIDKMFIELQRNIEFGAQHMRMTCPPSLAENVEYFLEYSLISSQKEVDKFTSCRMIIEDLIPMSFHSHVLSSGYPSEVLIKMNPSVKQYMKAFMEEKWKEGTKGERRFRTVAAKSTNIFLMVEFCSHLFHIDFDFDKELSGFESALSEVQNQENKVRKWRYLALITDHEFRNKPGSKWIVESLARRFYESYYHLTKPTSDPLEALIKFTKFVAMISRKAKEVLPDTKFFLMWLEFYTTLSFFLIAKITKEMQRPYSKQQDSSFFVPASYLHLVNFIEGTFPRHAVFIQKAVSHFSPTRTSHTLVQKRLDHIVSMVCGTSKSTSLINVLFSADMGQVFNCAMADRVLVLAMTLISNVGTFVSLVSETALMQALTQLQPPENCPKRLRLALESIHQAWCIRDVGVALDALLREHEGEHLMCCKWIPISHRKDQQGHVQSSPLTNIGLLPANFLGENTLVAISHESGLGIEVMELFGDHEEEIQMSMEEKMKWEIDTAAREKARTEKESGIKILRFFRRLVLAAKCHHLKARVQEQMATEELEDKMKMFETAKVTDVMCGICNVSFEWHFDQNMTEDMVYDWSAKTNANNTYILDFESKVGSGSLATLNLTEMKAKELEKIKVEHIQSWEHIQKQLEFHSFRKMFMEKLEPNIKFMEEKIQQYELDSSHIRSTVYSNMQLEINRILRCMTSMNHEVKRILHEKSWKTTHLLQQLLHDTFLAYNAVQHYLDEAYITFKQVSLKKLIFNS